MRRFLQHTLPYRFQKIRYYGFLSSSAKKKWEKICEYFKIIPIDPKNISDESKDEKQMNHCKSQMTHLASILRGSRAPPPIYLTSKKSRIK